MVNGPIKHGDFVAFHVPERLKKWVVNHDILPPNTSLLKRVLDLKSDHIFRKNTLIFVNERHFATAKLSDKADRSMPSWQVCVTLTDDQFFLGGDHPDSFDSRYFGPIRSDLIIAKAIKFRIHGWRHNPTQYSIRKEIE